MSELQLMGWREWLGLPELGIAHIKAKIDTGARTSALHADSIAELAGGRIRFAVRPRADSPVRWCEVPVIDKRRVTDSGGHREIRPVIQTEVSVGGVRWQVEVTLTSRVNMLFPMLLGRTAMRGRFAVDPARSYLFGKPGRPAGNPTQTI